MKAHKAMNGEFSRLVGRDKLAEAGSLHEIEADAEERQALARRFGLVALDRLSARVAVAPAAGGTLLRLTGQLEADLVQACVVTLEPLRSHIVEAFEQLYSLAEMPAATGQEIGDLEVEVVPEDEDPPEPVGPEGIDIGELVAQQLAVAIDPYPRAEGASLEALNEAQGTTGSNGEAAAEGPFSALATLKRGR